MKKREELSKGDLVAWKTGEGFDLVLPPYEKSKEPVGVVVGVTKLHNPEGKPTPGVMVLWSTYKQPFWTPTSMVEAISNTK